MVQRKQSRFIQAVLFIAGFTFVCGAVYFFVHGIQTYIQQLDQRDWAVTTAKVIYVDERIESSGTRSRTHHKVYDIFYQYEAGENVYTGTIYGVNTGKDYGETFDIKYDPDSPKDSTHYLKPTAGSIVSGILGFLIFGLVGSFMMRNALSQKKKSTSHKRTDKIVTKSVDK